MSKVYLLVIGICVSAFLVVAALTTHVSEHRSYYISKSMKIDKTVAYSVCNDWIQLLGKMAGRQIGSWWIPINEHTRPPLDSNIVDALTKELAKIDIAAFRSCHGSMSPSGYSFQIRVREAPPISRYINIEFNHDGTLKRRYEFAQ